MSTQTALPPDHDPLPPGTDLAALEPKKKKHKSGTLRRALSWLRGRKKKKPEAKQAESKENAKPDGQSQPIPPLEEESPDNAFFPSRRTAHLKNIHTQAQEGLKSLQRREKHHNKDQLQEDNTASEKSTDASEEAFRTRSLSCSTENTDDAMSVRSEMIQRKGSTFRPYDSPNWSSNKPGRRRKEKRATVVGVPHHIAAELGLNTPSFHRGVHELFSKTENQPSEKAAMTPKVNGVQRDGEEYVVIPTVDGMPAETPRNGAHISLSTLEQTETALKRHIEKVYQDDSCIGWKTGQKISPLLIRPKSVAVPGMTTHSPQSDPVSPVMSISPQGTYMSKIIPNAVLPPLVDVVALTHSSVRTLSRCSLASASPASIRGSLRRGRGMSTSSDTWSRSQSTETIVSDSSTISSRGGENTLEVSEKNESGLSTGRASPALSTGTQDGSDAASLCSGRSSVRSVSLRKSRKAPPPPKRTYSLQQQREMGLPPRPEKKTTNKTSNARDPWVPRTDKTVENEVFHPKVSSPTRSDRTLSPSSGYSSQSGTPTLPVRSLLESPGTRRRTPPKPERSSLKSASSINASSSPSENNPTVFVSPPRAGLSKEDEDGQDIIPPHPNVPAPTCPPPTQSIDLLVTPVVTPAPSPPPSHHPTPPPVRKSESEAEIPPSALKEETVKESSWPPPPPEVPDIQDLSMADFPPPEDDLFLPPPPSMEPESARTPSQIDCINDSNETSEAEKPLLISKDETPLETVKTQTNDVPLANTNAPETTVTDNSETPTKSVLDSKNDMQQPAVPPTSEAAVLHSAADNSEELPEMVYKPHFVSTPSAEITESKEQLEVSVSQDTSVDSTTCKQESKVSTDNSVSPKVSTASIVSQSPVDSSVSVTPTSTVTPSIPLSPSSGSALPLSKVWKPVSAPSSRKLPNNQAIAAQPKEDASLPIVTPSLLQMVRLRSVQARGPQIPFSQLPSGIPAPQKPVRKSLSMRSSLGSDSSQGESPTQPTPSPQKPPDSPSNRSPASAASFVFARGSKKFVFEPPVSPEAESSLKRDLVAELKLQGGPRSPDGKPPIQRKPSKIPPPVARKPSVGIPRTPTTPSNATEGTSGNAVTPQEAVSVPPPSGTSASGTLENHEEQHKSRMEQA